jgi:hypothetical protein
MRDYRQVLSSSLYRVSVSIRWSQIYKLLASQFLCFPHPHIVILFQSPGIIGSLSKAPSEASIKCLPPVSSLGVLEPRGVSLSGPSISSRRHTIKVLTRNASSPHAQELRSPTVSLVEWNCFNETDLIRAFRGIDSCFINTDGFAVGEKNEIY